MHDVAEDVIFTTVERNVIIRLLPDGDAMKAKAGKQKNHF